MNGNYYGGGYNPAYDAYYGTPYMQGRMPNTPPVENALSGEEIKILMNTKPNSDKLNLNISKEDYLRAMCTHRDLNGNDAVREMTDGSKNVWCPICGAIWNPTEVPLEEVKDAVKTLINHMENAKWIGNYPKAVTRQYFNMLPLVRKFPDLYVIIIIHGSIISSLIWDISRLISSLWVILIIMYHRLQCSHLRWQIQQLIQCRLMLHSRLQLLRHLIRMVIIIILAILMVQVQVRIMDILHHLVQHSLRISQLHLHSRMLSQ